MADRIPVNVLDEIAIERKRQDAKWGGPRHDDEKPLPFFIQHIQDYAGWARVMWNMDSYDKARRRLLQVAALAVAAVESMDRRFSMPSSVQPLMNGASYAILLKREPGFYGSEVYWASGVYDSERQKFRLSLWGTEHVFRADEVIKAVLLELPKEGEEE